MQKIKPWQLISYMLKRPVDQLYLAVLDVTADHEEYLNDQFIHFPKGARLTIDTLPNDEVRISYSEESKLKTINYDPLRLDGSFISSEYQLVGYYCYGVAPELRNKLNEELFIDQGLIDESGDLPMDLEENVVEDAMDRLVTDELTGNAIFVADTKK